jgi:hypothetical protein
MRFLTLFITAALSSSAWAQFDPNPLFISKTAPTPSPERLCQEFSGHALTVCNQAIRTALDISYSFSTVIGKYLGCVDGTNQGIREGFDEKSSPSKFQIQKSKENFQNIRPASATKRANEKAHLESDSKAIQDVIQIYREAVGKRINGDFVVDNSPREQTSSWNGFEDGYDHDYNVQYETALISSRWISANDPIDRKIAANSFYQFNLDPNYSPKNFCPSKNQTLTLWDYYLHAANSTNFKPKRGQEIVNIFLAESSTPGRTFYDSIPNFTNIIQVQVPVPQVVKPGDQSDSTKIIPQTKTVQQEIRISEQETAQLRKVFLDVLKQGYEDRYLNDFYAEYNKAGTAYFQSAKPVGEKVGLDYAKKYADAMAYNARYQTTSRDQFLSKLNEYYLQKFNETVEKFETNAILELSNLAAIESKNDGVFLRGEEIYFRYRFKNLGKASTNMQTSVKATQYIQPINEDCFDIPGLSMLERTTELPIARISPATPIGERLMMTVSLNGGLTFDKKLFGDELASIRSSQNTFVSVATMASVDSVVPSIDLFTNPHRSTLNIEVNLSNESSSPVDMPVKIKTIVTGFGEFENETLLKEKLGANGKSQAYISIKEIDTLALIDRKQISGKVEAYIGNELTGSRDFSIKLKDDERSNVVAYFSKIASGQNLADALGDRMNELYQKLDFYITQDIRNGTSWKRPTDVDRTIIRLLQRKYNADRNTMTMGTFAYEKIGETFSSHVHDISGAKNRKKFLSEIRKFAPSIKANPKDYE